MEEEKRTLIVPHTYYSENVWYKVGVLAKHTCSAIENEYVPVYCLYDRMQKRVGMPDGKEIILYKYLSPMANRYIRSAVNLNRKLWWEDAGYRQFGDMGYDKVVYASIPNEYVVNYGVILFRDEPLMMLCAKSRYINKIDTNSPDPKMFSLLIDKKLRDELDHYKLYKVIKKPYIDVMEDLVDIVYTADIKDLCFRPFTLASKTTTITEMVNEYKRMNLLLKKALAINFDIISVDETRTNHVAEITERSLRKRVAELEERNRILINNRDMTMIRRLRTNIENIEEGVNASVGLSMDTEAVLPESYTATYTYTPITSSAIENIIMPINTGTTDNGGELPF